MTTRQSTIRRRTQPEEIADLHARIKNLELRLAAAVGGGGAGEVTWDDVTGKPSTFPSDWDDITDKPAEFPPEDQPLDWLTDVDVAGVADGQRLEYQAGVWVPVTPDAAGFGGGVWVQALTNRGTTAADGALTQWGETLIVADPGEEVDLAVLLTGYAALGAAVALTDIEVRVDYSTDGGSTWTLGAVTAINLSSATGVDIDRGALAASVAVHGVTPTGAIHARAMSRRFTSTSGAGNFQNGRLTLIIPGGSGGGGGGGGSVAWADITGKPTTFPPTEHDNTKHNPDFLALTGGAMSGDIAMGTNRLTNLGAPTAVGHAVTAAVGYTDESVGVGPTIHIGTGAPSGGRDNDVWLRY